MVNTNFACLTPGSLELLEPQENMERRGEERRLDWAGEKYDSSDLTTHLFVVNTQYAI